MNTNSSEFEKSELLIFERKKIASIKIIDLLKVQTPNIDCSSAREKKYILWMAWGGVDFTHVSTVYLNLPFESVMRHTILVNCFAQINQKKFRLFQKHIKHFAHFLFWILVTELRVCEIVGKKCWMHLLVHFITQ